MDLNDRLGSVPAVVWEGRGAIGGITLGFAATGLRTSLLGGERTFAPNNTRFDGMPKQCTGISANANFIPAPMR